MKTEFRPRVMINNKAIPKLESLSRDERGNCLALGLRIQLLGGPELVKALLSLSDAQVTDALNPKPDTEGTTPEVIDYSDPVAFGELMLERLVRKIQERDALAQRQQPQAALKV